MAKSPEFYTAPDGSKWIVTPYKRLTQAQREADMLVNDCDLSIDGLMLEDQESIDGFIAELESKGATEVKLITGDEVHFVRFSYLGTVHVVGYPGGSIDTFVMEQYFDDYDRAAAEAAAV